MGRSATPAPAATPRQRRREATTAEIMEAAWVLCREGGLAALSMRELADQVGMAAPSLYSYFDSKDAIYDGMFRHGYERLRVHMEPWRDERPVTRELLKETVGGWVDFCMADTTRYQLLFQRVVPGFEPSADSYAIAVEVLGDMAQMLADAGVDDPAALDLWTALLTGLMDQQNSNDPGGDRWTRLVDEAIDMYLDHQGVLPQTRKARQR